MGLDDRPTHCDIEGTHWHGTLWAPAKEASALRLRNGNRSKPTPRPEHRNRDGESVQRAKRKARRFAVSYDLGIWATLTYREPVHNERKVRRHTRRFLRDLRIYGFRGRRLPWIMAVHQHPGGHGLHVHLLLPFVEKGLIRKAWKHGFADVHRLPTEAHIGRAAEYMTDQDRPPGKHHYDVAKGFPLDPPMRVCSHDLAEVEEVMVALMGGEQPTSSRRSEGRRGPPWMGFRWWKEAA